MHKRLSIPAKFIPAAAEPTAQAANSNGVPPVFCSIQDWVSYSGMSRSATYQGIKEKWLPSLKLGKTRLIDRDRAVAAVRARFSCAEAA